MSANSIEPSRSGPLGEAWARAYARGQGAATEQVPEPEEEVNPRAAADARAAWRRWHHPLAGRAFSTSEWPWYATLERARVELLASRDLPGVARNLRALDLLAPAQTGLAQIYRAARLILAGEADTIEGPIETAGQRPVRGLGGFLRRFFQDRLAEHSAPRGDRELRALMDGAVPEALRTARDQLEDPRAFAETLRPLVIRLARLHADDTRELPPVEGSMAPSRAGDSPMEIEDQDATHERAGGTAQDPMSRCVYDGYPIFSRVYDEESPATRWYRPEDSTALRALDVPDRRRVRQLAHRLQRRLQAARLRHWNFDQEEGLLDARRLVRIVSEPGNRRIFRQEEAAPVPEACVTLLVDQSGSMRPIQRLMAAQALDLAAHTLEVCRIRCEVLGYTTPFGADNPVARSWRERDRPANPGRLNALRHIVYKRAEQPWRRARLQLGLFLRPDFGHENFDGEALHWAARRLFRRPEPRKILLVLSDGTPFDEATAAANGRAFLEDHMRNVIAELEDSPVHLVAIGAGTNVSRFYRNACAIRRPEAVPEVLFERLGDLLTAPHLSGARP